MSLFDKGDRDALVVAYTGAGSTATITVAVDRCVLKVDGGTVLAVDLHQHKTIAQLATAIDAVADFTASAENGFGSKLALNGLERASAADLKAGAVTIRRPPEVVDEIALDTILQSAVALFGGDIYPEYLWRKVLAAEADIEKRLRVFLEPVEVLPENAKQAELDALGDTRYHLEGGYDYDPGIFEGNRWGFMTPRERPILAVRSIQLVHPTPEMKIFTIPPEWIRTEGRYGQINLIPNTAASSVPLNAYILSVLGGGRNIPHMIEIRYQAGLRDVEGEYPHLVDAIKKEAVVKVIKDRFFPASQSISADGLSESQSIDISKYEEYITDTVNQVRDEIHGPRAFVI